MKLLYSFGSPSTTVESGYSLAHWKHYQRIITQRKCTASTDGQSKDRMPPCLFKKRTEVHERAMHLAQTTISMCLRERQVNNKESQTTQPTLEMPEQLAMGLAAHQAIRSKEIVNMLHGFRMSVEYDRLSQGRIADRGTCSSAYGAVRWNVSSPRHGEG